MLFINLTPGQISTYTYACEKLQHTLNKMTKARTTLQHVADSAPDKSFAKCVYLITSESQQFENEIHAQIDCFNCLDNTTGEERAESKQSKSVSVKNIETLCKYLEENYIKSYRRLLKDKYLNSSVKKLISNHLQMLLSSLTQLRLFKEVRPSMN